MILTILDFDLSKTIIVECSSTINDIDAFVNDFLGHSSFQYMTSDSLKIDFKIPLEDDNSHINIREKGKGVLFNGSFKSLTENISDCFNIAEALRTDIDCGNIEEDDNAIDFELYNNFSQKYQ